MSGYHRLESLLAPHPHPAGIPGYLAVVLMWFVMMSAMMLPAVMPWLTTFAKMAGDAYPGRKPRVLVAQFIGGYLAAWMTYSAVAAALQGLFERASLLTPDLTVSAYVGGALLILAGIFQLTPLKEACLSHCRSPLSFFLERWDGRPAGPFRMGARHGIWCVGCCWALMALAFVLGVMNLAWMAALTVFVVAEQRAPRALRLARVAGFGFTAWGAWLIFR